MTIAGAWGSGRRTWLALAVAAAAALAAGLAPVPPGLAAADASTSSAFAALASFALVTVSILPALLWRSPARRQLWIGIAVLGLGLGAGSFVAGGSAERACTAQYAGRAVMIGSELTTVGAAYVRDNPGLSTDELLFDSAGVPDRVWTRQSIDRCRTLVGSTYFLWIPFLAICLLAALRAAGSSARPTLAPTPASAARGAPPAGLPPASDLSRPALRYDVFISYRHGARDTAFARQLATSLEEDGYVVAFDERDFPANASFLLEMERCIRESRFTVAVVSPRYFESDNTQEEAIISKVLDLSERKRRLIPLVIEPVSLPVWLYGIVGIDFAAPDPFIDPLEKLKLTIGPPGLNHP